MKPSKSSLSILIAALSFSAVLGAIIFTTRSAAGARVQAGTSALSTTPLEGVEVILECRACKPRAKVKAKTDAAGVVNVVSSLPSLDRVTLQCKSCDRMDIGPSGVQFTLTGLMDKNFKRILSKQELVDGKEFQIELAASETGRERRHEYKGVVSIIK